MITAWLSLVQRTSVSTAKPSSAAEVSDSNVCSGYFSSPPRCARMSDPVGSLPVEVCEGLPDGELVTEGGREADPEFPGSPVVGRWKYHTPTPTASSKTTELATATNKPVRLGAAVRSLLGPADADGRSSSGSDEGGKATGGTGGVVPGAWTPAPPADIDGFAVSPRASLKVSLSTRKSRRVSKLTGLISTACRRVNLANPLGSSRGDGILALS